MAWRRHHRDTAVDGQGGTEPEGRSMPHGPRRHDGRSWPLDSGTGRFGHLDGARQYAPLLDLEVPVWRRRP
jgi:hypothetical protein